MSWDVIVIGCGGFGAACLAELCGRGLRVLGLDQFAPPHDRGSSHGETRIIRKAYFEHPDYVPLLHRAWDLWADLSDRHGGGLLNRCDLVMTGEADSVVVRGARESAALHGLAVENLTAAEGRARYPVLAIPESHDVVVEVTAGWLAVERCVAAHLQQAKDLGAELQTGVHVTGVRGSGTGVEVDSSVGRFSAGELFSDPGQVRRELTAADAVAVDGFVGRHLRGLQAGAVHGAVCQYSMSPDGHFLVDRHAEWPVVVNAGFSGHGFKFTPVIAEAAADLVERGRTGLPIDFLSRRRLGVV